MTSAGLRDGLYRGQSQPVTAHQALDQPQGLGRQSDDLVELKEFTTLTCDLLALSDWSVASGVTHVALERTGEYWQPIVHLLDGNV
jgi:hypothetical protein